MPLLTEVSKLLLLQTEKEEWTKRKLNPAKQKESMDEQNLSNSEVPIFQS